MTKAEKFFIVRISIIHEREVYIMIFKRLRELLEEQFSIPTEDLTEETLLVGDLALDFVELAMALEETFMLETLEDLSNLETIGDLLDFLQMELDM